MPSGNVPPPTQHPDEPEFVCIPVNREWIPILLGALQPLKYPEYWSGTLDENRGARKDFGLLLDQIMQAEECNMATCCEDKIYIKRLNPETGRLERSSDDGATWTTDPTDPTNIVVKQPPPVTDGGSTTKCDAASNFSQHWNDLITASSENLGTATTIVELASGLAAIIIDIIIAIVTEGAGLVLAVTIADAIFAGITAAFGEGKTAFDAYWTSDNKDKILCAAFCTMGDNGQFSQTEWEDFKHKVRADLPAGAALDMVLTAANAGGYVGGSNMASYGFSADSDCSECCPSCAGLWDVYDETHGTILSRDETQITIEATFIGSGYYVILSTMAADVCCIPLGYDVISGTVNQTGNLSWTSCGTAPVEGVPESAFGLFGWASEINYMQVQSSVPFTLQFNFDAP